MGRVNGGTGICRGITAACSVATVDRLSPNVYVDPHQLRDAEAWGAATVRVASGRVDLEGPASTGHATVVWAQAATLAPGDGGNGLVTTFEYPVHLRYASPSHGGAPTVFAIDRPHMVLVRCSDDGPDAVAPGVAASHDLVEYARAAGVPTDGWRTVTYAGLCDHGNITDAVLVRDLVNGHSDQADIVTWVTLAVTTAGAVAVIAATASVGAHARHGH